MGWHTAAFFVEQMTTDELIAGFPGTFTYTGQSFQVAEAFSALPVPFAVGQVGAWTMLCDPLCIITWRDKLLASFSQGRRILAWIMESTSSTCGFWYYVDGELIRHILYQEDSSVEEQGHILRVEQEREVLHGPYDEDYILWMLERLTGLTWQELAAVTLKGLNNELYMSRTT
jgi:hypothetical protein